VEIGAVGVEGLVSGNETPRTVSGPGGSSTKRVISCAIGVAGPEPTAGSSPGSSPSKAGCAAFL
jgi:hypothetical protein